MYTGCLINFSLVKPIALSQIIVIINSQLQLVFVKARCLLGAVAAMNGFSMRLSVGLCDSMVPLKMDANPISHDPTMRVLLPVRRQNSFPGNVCQAL